MVRIIAVQSIENYFQKHANSKDILEAWAAIVRQCTWTCPLDIVETFGKKAVDILGKKDTKAETTPPNRVVLDVGGNNLRIIAKYQFHVKQKMCWLFIKWIGTHAEYDKICAKKQQYDIDIYK